jgi:aerobic carbon-monoxide dehydrogenase large subunit
MATVHRTLNVGAPLARFEDERFVKGEARYVGDLKRPGMLHAAFVRSYAAHARITAVHVDGALALDGVHAVYTGIDTADLDDFPLIVRNDEEIVREMHPVLAGDEVRYVGQPIALVVADSAELAADAAELVIVALDELPLDDSRVLVRWHRTNGDVDAAFARADRVVRSQVVAPRLIAAPIEARAVLAEYDGDVLTLWLSAQDQHRQLGGLSKVLRRPADKLRVIVPDVGGAFGSKGVPQAETAAVAFAALELSRPVKWAEARTESSLATYQGRGQRIETELAVTDDGAILGLRAHVHADLGGYLYTTTPVAPMTCAMLLTGCYAIPAVDVQVTGVCTNKVPTGPYRGAGRPEAALAIETAIDTAARELGIDPVELRRRNIVREFPYENGLGFTYDSGDYEGALDAALELADVAWLQEQAALARAAGRLAGIGTALYVERCGPGSETGTVRLCEDGSVIALTGSSPHGQGHETTFAQIVADELGVEPAMIEVRWGDSFEVPDGTGTFASRSVAAGGSALLLAAREVRSRLEAGEAAPIEVATRFQLPGPVFSFGSYVAAVEIEPETGEVEITRIAAVDDCGRVINPLLAEGQVVGAVVQAVGECLYEYVGYDEYGQPLAVNFYDYHLPTAQTVPPIASGLRETASPLNPLGAKGIGEGGSIGTPAAVANAVADALAGRGIGRLDAPYTPARVWHALQRGSQSIAEPR